MNQMDIYSVLAGSVGETVVLRGGSHAPIKVASVHRAGASITLVGTTLDGRAETRSVLATGASPLMPPWMRHLASMLRIAGMNWDEGIKALITDAGLPVEHNIDWNKVLNAMFIRAGLAVGDPAERSDLIHLAVVSIIKRRALERFNPNLLTTPVDEDEEIAPLDDEDKVAYADLPLAKKVTIWILQLFKWQVGSEVMVNRTWVGVSHSIPSSQARRTSRTTWSPSTT